MSDDQNTKIKKLMVIINSILQMNDENLQLVCYCAQFVNFNGYIVIN